VDYGCRHGPMPSASPTSSDTSVCL
jgi:hypothetical protein